MSKEILLTQGKSAIVDDADFERVAQFKWHYTASTGYAARRDHRLNRQILMHRFIMDAESGIEVDHINGDKLDNRRLNLRFATRQENSHNSRGMPNTVSRYKGLSYCDGHYYVRLMLNGVQGYYGRYKDERIAAKVYDFAASTAFGDFAKLNFPDEPLMDEDEFYGHIMAKPLKSQYRGVSQGKGKWIAYIQVKRKFVHLGYFTDEIEAARAYNAAAIKYHGPKAKLNPLEDVR